MIDNFAEKVSSMIGKIFELDEDQKKLAIEGFEPNTVAIDVSIPHVIKLIDASLSSYDNSQNKYSEEVTKIFRSLAKDLLTEISEGFNQGISDLQLILRDKFSRYISSAVGEDTASLFRGMLWPNLWKKIESLKDSPNMIVKFEDFNHVVGRRKK